MEHDSRNGKIGTKFSKPKDWNSILEAERTWIKILESENIAKETVEKDLGIKRQWNNLQKSGKLEQEPKAWKKKSGKTVEEGSQGRKTKRHWNKFLEVTLEP